MYYTNGSVSNLKATSAFYNEGFARSVRLNNKATILQAELYAIKLALQYSNDQGQGREVTHSDSLSALQSLSRRIPTDI